MQRIFLFVAFQALVLRCAGQADRDGLLSKDDYLQKSRHQKTIGFVLLVTSGVAMATSVPFFSKASGGWSLNILDDFGATVLLAEVAHC